MKKLTIKELSLVSGGEAKETFAIDAGQIRNTNVAGTICPPACQKEDAEWTGGWWVTNGHEWRSYFYPLGACECLPNSED